MLTTTVKNLLPSARFFSWQEKGDDFQAGKVHSKIVLADRQKFFVTSANLTGSAMETNMEAGLLLTGGSVPGQVYDHLQSLMDLEVVTENA